jgi:23S rRNA maturation-related 3'-5' exoribonuclease YhaM
MFNMDKVNVFKEELDYINDSRVKNFTIKALSSLPDYFFKIPASSSGKYHPKITTKEGGLVIHTKLAVRVLKSMLNLNMMEYTDIQKDIAISAMILHDGLKSGYPQTKYTAHEHPILVCDYLLKQEGVCDYISKPILDKIFSCIKSHMGQWTTGDNSNVVLPKPESGLEKLVHIADYISSRKNIFDMEV